MNKFRCSALLSVLSLTSAAAAFGQDQTAPSLLDLLKNQYKVTTTGSDLEGFKIIEPGTVLTLLKGGLMATAQNNPFGKMCANNFKNGNLSTGRGCAMSAQQSRYLDKGSKVYVTKLEVKSKENKVTFSVVECDACNGTQVPSSMRATINFEFENKFLDTAEPSQVAEVINQVLAPEASAATQPAPQQAAPTVQIGDTPRQVISILGNPIVVLPGAGGKQIYKYKDFKVIFVGGKVVEVD